MPDSELFDDAGHLWLLESNISNEVRVRKILQKDLNKPASAFSIFIRRSLPEMIIAPIIILAILLIFYTGRKILPRNIKKHTQPFLA